MLLLQRVSVQKHVETQSTNQLKESNVMMEILFQVMDAQQLVRLSLLGNALNLH